MIRVRRPSTAQARSDPMNAFPRPIQVEASPYFQPNWPAYPTKVRRAVSKCGQPGAYGSSAQNKAADIGSMSAAVKPYGDHNSKKYNKQQNFQKHGNCPLFQLLCINALKLEIIRGICSIAAHVCQSANAPSALFIPGPAGFDHPVQFVKLFQAAEGVVGGNAAGPGGGRITDAFFRSVSIQDRG